MSPSWKEQKMTDINQPICAIESESAVLSLCMTKGKQEQTVRQCMDDLSADMFYLKEHQDLYRFFFDNDNADYYQAIQHFKTKPDFNMQTLYGLTNYTTALANMAMHCEIIVNKSMRRKLQATAYSVLQQAYETDVSDIKEFIISELEGLNQLSSYEPVHLREAAHRYTETLQKRANGDESTIGIKTGFDALDSQIGGFGRTWMIVLAGRPSHGKTLISQVITSNISESRPTLFFSLEMSETELMDRDVTLNTNISPREIRTGLLKDTQFVQLTDRIRRIRDGEIKQYIDTTPGLTIHQISARVKKFKKLHPDAGLITIDYLGLMGRPKAERNDIAIGQITRGLKQLSKEVEIPILLLVQCNRGADTAKRLQMSNLADSADIERDADLVMFCHRDDVANVDSPKKNIIEISKGKFRHDNFSHDVYLEATDYGLKCLTNEEAGQINHKEYLESRDKNTRGFDV